MFIGAVAIRLVTSGGFGWFLQQRMRLPLLIGGIVALLLGLVEVWTATREERADPAARTRTSAPRVGWLLILPIVVLIAVAPTGLGAAAADRVDAYVPFESADPFGPLPEGNPPELRVFDFVDRALWDDARSLEGAEVALEGLVVNDDEAPDGFLLTRFLVSCCAADGIPIQVGVRSVATPLEDDTWVRVVVRWIPTEPGAPTPDLVEAELISLEVVDDPPNTPYESPY
jgi:uncharacterized repeat protein (TIGR03943 family)